MDDLPIRAGLVIPAAELTATFSRSGGPGGQNVNKVASRVTLRFALSETRVLPTAAVRRLRTLARGRLNRAGDLVLVGQQHRHQARNLAECRDRLRALIAEALVKPKRRVATRRSRGSIERRLQKKKRVADKKKNRGSGPHRWLDS